MGFACRSPAVGPPVYPMAEGIDWRHPGVALRSAAHGGRNRRCLPDRKDRDVGPALVGVLPRLGAPAEAPRRWSARHARTEAGAARGPADNDSGSGPCRAPLRGLVALQCERSLHGAASRGCVVRGGCCGRWARVRPLRRNQPFAQGTDRGGVLHLDTGRLRGPRPLSRAAPRSHCQSPRAGAATGGQQLLGGCGGTARGTRSCRHRLRNASDGLARLESGLAPRSLRGDPAPRLAPRPPHSSGPEEHPLGRRALRRVGQLRRHHLRPESPRRPKYRNACGPWDTSSSRPAGGAPPPP